MALVCTDTRSKMTRIFVLFKKDHQFRAFLDMIPWSETQTGTKVRFFRSDGDWEAKEVKSELIRLGIEHRLTRTDTPTSNAIAERMGGVLGEKAGGEEQKEKLGRLRLKYFMERSLSCTTCER